MKRAGWDRMDWRGGIGMERRGGEGLKRIRGGDGVCGGVVESWGRRREGRRGGREEAEAKGEGGGEVEEEEEGEEGEGEGEDGEEK